MGKPRTVRYWPKMKVRGARNRRMEKYMRTARAFDQIGKAAVSAAAATGIALTDMAATLARVAAQEFPELANAAIWHDHQFPTPVHVTTIKEQP